MKLDPSTITKARDWFAKRWVMFAVGGACLFLLAVLVVNLRAGAGHTDSAPAKAAVASSAPANAMPATKVAQASPAIPQITQQPAAMPAARAIGAPATATPTTVAVAADTAAPVAAPIQPPRGIQRGFVVEKRFQEDQFGTQVLIETKAVGVQAISVQAPATDTGFSGPATSVDWSAWINLTKPATLAWVRLAGGQGTVTASIDGVTLGGPIEHWGTSGPTSTMASVALATGWHQIKIHDARAHWVNGSGVAVRVDLGDGAGDPVSPQPWAVTPGVPVAVPVPHIAQQPAPASASSVHKPTPVSTTGAEP